MLEEIDFKNIYVCRSIICKYCADAGRPNGNEKILLYSDDKRFRVKNNTDFKLLNDPDKYQLGYTPHIIEQGKEIENGYQFKATCLVDGCGVTIKEKIIQSLEDYVELESRIKDNIIQFQNTLFNLQTLVSQIKKNKLSMRHKKDLDAIIGQSALFFIEHEKILESHFSPGRYAFNYLRSREISFDRNMLFKLINNDRNMFPQNFILKAH